MLNLILDLLLQFFLWLRYREVDGEIRFLILSLPINQQGLASNPEITVALARDPTEFAVYLGMKRVCLFRDGFYRQFEPASLWLPALRQLHSELA